MLVRRLSGAILIVALSPSCAPPVAEPCAGQGKGCLVLSLSGGPGGLDAVRVVATDVTGLVPPHTDEWAVAGKWPAEVPLVLTPGTYRLVGVGYTHGAPSAVAHSDLAVTGQPGRVELSFVAYGGATCDDGLVDGDETDLDCGGSCPACAPGRRCAADLDCGMDPKGPVCLAGRCAAPTCTDLRRDGAETDVDCGGDCSACNDGGACGKDADCRSSRCDKAVCRPLDCYDGRKGGTETDVDCGGIACTACDSGGACLVPRDCASGLCEAGHCAAPSCFDKWKNGQETDTDCGGNCPACTDGKACAADVDCTSHACVASRCAPPACNDARKNGSETDVDCGANCPACADGKTCSNPIDCQSLSCAAGRCAVPGCADRVRNGDEADVDCGGMRCPACVPGATCKVATDCRSRVCNKSRCEPPVCGDNVKNGDESDVDCGGSCTACADGGACAAGHDCASGVCQGGACQAPTCMDGVHNGKETDRDCGGPCPACADGKRCLAGADCKSGVCGGGLCRAARCGDNAQNGDETDVDCGGSCAPCADNHKCAIAGDCLSGVCTNAVCQPPTCYDNVKNGAESDVDCGGGCGACTDGRACAAATDCRSMRCERFICRSCSDGIKSGAETDVDCGGGACAACADLKACVQPADCLGGSCALGVCRSCDDGVKNGDESDVDCGGNECGKCADLFLCVSNLDCLSGRCAGGRCGSCSDGQKNGPETDVDCGGSCAPCADRKACAVAGDCVSGRCEGGKCSSCNDGAMSGPETDVDCGGGLCAPCALTKSCLVDKDCTSARCFAAKCVVPMTITSITPPFGPSGKSTNITIIGSNFDPLAAVTVGGVGGLNVTWVTPTKITLATPILMNAFGATTVVVKNPTGLTVQGSFYEQAQTVKFQSYLPSPSLPARPTDFAPGDFDKDGKNDLAVALPAANQVAILLGKGDGTFAAPLLFPTGNGPRGVVAGDFDNDGRLDVATSDNGANTISVLLGDGAGRLGAPKAHALPIAPDLIDAADFNRDGKLDVVAARSSVVLALGNGDGTFAPAVVVLNSGQEWLRLLDENRDGFIDVVLGVGSEFVTLPGKGDGTFKALKTSGASGGQHVFFGADLDADFLPDAFAAGSPLQLNFLPYRFMRGNASGDFPWGGSDMSIGSAGLLDVRRLDAADLNSDGKPELLLIGIRGEIAFATGSGTAFNSTQGFVGTGSPPVDYLVGDWDGDKKVDLLVLSDTLSRVHFFGGNGDLTFRGPVALETDSATDLVAVDLSGDGAIDVAETGGGGTMTWLARKNGYKSPYSNYRHPQFSLGHAIYGGVLTPSGYVDLVVDGVGTLLSTGKGFQVPITGVAGSPGALGDYDGDGLLDYVTVKSGLDNPIYFQHGRGIGTFLDGVRAALNFPRSSQLGSGDFDGDGNLDVIGDDRGNGALQVFRGAGDGTVVAGATVIVGQRPVGVTVADLDQDGKPDLVSALDTDKAIAVALGNGDGTFRVLARVALPNAPLSRVAVGDLDGDNRPDLLVGSAASTALVLINQGGGVFTVAVEVPVGPAFERAAIADLNGDGKGDLVLGADGTTASYVIFNQSQ